MDCFFCIILWYFLEKNCGKKKYVQKKINNNLSNFFFCHFTLKIRILWQKKKHNIKKDIKKTSFVFSNYNQTQKINILWVILKLFLFSKIVYTYIGIEFWAKSFKIWILCPDMNISNILISMFETNFITTKLSFGGIALT